jgi:hypothetical protein
MEKFKNVKAKVVLPKWNSQKKKKKIYILVKKKIIF